MKNPNLISLQFIKDFSIEDIMAPLRDMRLINKEGQVSRHLKSLKNIVKKMDKSSDNCYLSFSPKVKAYKNKLFSEKIGGISSRFCPMVSYLLEKGSSEEEILNQLRKVYPKNMYGEYLYFVGEFNCKNMILINHLLTETIAVQSGYNQDRVSTYSHMMSQAHTNSLEYLSFFADRYGDSETWAADAYAFIEYDNYIRFDLKIASKYFKIMEKFMEEVYQSWKNDYGNYPNPQTYRFLVSQYQPFLSSEVNENWVNYFEKGKDCLTNIVFFGRPNSQQENRQFNCLDSIRGDRRMVPFLYYHNAEGDFTHQYYADLILAHHRECDYIPLKDDASCT